MIKITQGKGFHITYKNGYTVSVQFGQMNYSSNRNLTDEYSLENEARLGSKGSQTAEVAIWKDSGKFIRLPGWNDDVKGWVLPEEITGILAYVASIPSA